MCSSDLGAAGTGSASDSSRSRSGGRAATQAAAMRPASAVAGTNQVQSTVECTPKTIAT